MGGFCGVISEGDCVSDLFFGTDYHSHLGTHRGGMAVLGPKGFQRSIHNIQNSPFRSRPWTTSSPQSAFRATCSAPTAGRARTSRCRAPAHTAARIVRTSAARKTMILKHRDREVLRFDWGRYGDVRNVIGST